MSDKPVICSDALCMFRYEELGMGVKVIIYNFLLIIFYFYFFFLWQSIWKYLK